MTTGTDWKLSEFPAAEWFGHTLAGWYTAPDGGTEATLDDVYSKDTTLYAHWTDGYVITFDPGSGYCSVKQKTTGTDGKLSDLPTATWDGHTFLGWYTDETGGTIVTTDTVLAPGITLYAHWTRECTITFDPNGGVMDERTRTTGTDGKLQTFPETVWLGHTFAGWYTAQAGGVQVTDQYVFEDDATVYAHWEEGYLIKFDPGSGESSATEMRTGTDGKLLTLPTATWTGHTFEGWYTAQTGGTIVTTDVVFTGSTTLYAHWSEGYVITFDPNDGSGAMTTMRTDLNGKLSELPAAEWFGHTFEGWYTDKTGGNQVTTDTVFMGSTTLYAHWTDGYTITFDPNGGSVDPATMITGTDGKLITLPTATRDGYTFLGWYTDQTSGTEVTTDTVFTGSTTLYAHWTDRYTITFDPNGGSVDPATMITGTDGKLSELPTAVRFGHTFMGWYTAPDGGDRVTEEHVFSASATVYAQWTDGYIITFDPNGGSVDPATMITGTDGKLSELPTPVRFGYTFEGWYTDAAGGDRVTDQYVFESDATVYACWSEGYAVTFDASPGTCSPAEVRTGTDGKISELPTATWSGHTFKGWYTDPNGGDPVTEATVLYGAVKLYAHWSVSPADDDDVNPVIPDGNGGSSGKAASKGASSAVVLIVACVAAVMAVLLAHTYCSKR